MALTKRKRRRERLPTRYTGNLAGVARIIERRDQQLDIYHRLLTMPWYGLFLVITVAYFVVNAIFAGLFALRPGSITNARPGSFLDAFFFSVQTMTTIGYGDMHPATVYAELLVTAEVIFFLTGLAVAAGLVFARFSRPTARVLFSKVAVVGPHNGVSTLMFRTANQRRNQILEAQVSVMLLRDEVTREGVPMRRFHDMRVERSRTPMFALSWTVMHPIDEASPLYGEDAESLAAINAEIVVGLVGIDETFSQTIHARHSYFAAEIHWDHHFADILSMTDDGQRVVDYRRFHDTVEAKSVPARRVKA